MLHPIRVSVLTYLGIRTPYLGADSYIFANLCVTIRWLQVIARLTLKCSLHIGALVSYLRKATCSSMFLGSEFD